MFFKVKTSDEVVAILKGFGPSGRETLVSLEDAFGRVLSRDMEAPEDLPGFFKATMDGYAVRARDTFGANESTPAFLEVTGEVLMGKASGITLGTGQAAGISTGGMLPGSSDGVVMREYCHLLDEKTIEVYRAITPLENVIRPDDDIGNGVIALCEGHRMRPQDLGLMAGLGIASVPVYDRPRVAIISTGDEVISIDRRPEAAQVRDINSYTLSAFCRQEGAEPLVMGLCTDSFEELRHMVERGIEESDTVWISGGSSVGTRDLTLKVLESFDHMRLIVHGISISPGKPTIIAKIGSRTLFGLPGHTASAMVVAEVFLRIFLAQLSGERPVPGMRTHLVEARLSRNIESKSGRDDYIRVRLDTRGETVMAEPIFGKSGLISTLVEAHGLVRIDRNTEGLYQGEPVEVMLFHSTKGGFR